MESTEPAHSSTGQSRSTGDVNIWQRQWSWKPDRYDAYGFALCIVVVLAIGLTVGSLRAWLFGVSIGCALANITSFMLRRVTPRGRRELIKRIEANRRPRSRQSDASPSDPTR